VSWRLDKATASRGLGLGALAFCLPAANVVGAEVLFQDDFSGQLGDGWSWVREDKAGWRVAGFQIPGRKPHREHQARSWGWSVVPGCGGSFGVAERFLAMNLLSNLVGTRSPRVPTD
jgi:hypothetical protein